MMALGGVEGKKTSREPKNKVLQKWNVDKISQNRELCVHQNKIKYFKLQSGLL